MLAEFSLKLVYVPTCAGIIFKFMIFTFLENALNLGIFSYVPPHSKIARKSLSLYPRQREIAHSPRQRFFRNLFSPTAERGGGNYDLLYQNSIRKYRDDLGQLDYLYFV